MYLPMLQFQPTLPIINDKMRLIIFLFMCFFFASCEEKTHEYFFSEKSKIKIDESEYVLTSNPENLYVINDSTLIASFYPRDILVYNYQTGKCIKKIDFNKINYDSLFRKHIFPKNKYLHFSIKPTGSYTVSYLNYD